MVQAASCPPLPRTQERGTHSSGTGKENTKSRATRPPDPMFEVGDVYPGGIRDGKHFDIKAVVTGEFARKAGCDVMIIGKERDVSKVN